MELVSIVAGLVHVYVDDVFTVVVGWTWDENHGGVDVVDSSMRKRK